MKDRHFLHFNTACFTYYNGAEVFYKLKIGGVLELIAEPKNRFDPYAAAVYFKIYELGYIPHDKNKGIYNFLLLGHNDIFIARINNIIENEIPEKQIGVTVKIKAKASITT